MVGEVRPHPAVGGAVGEMLVLGGSPGERFPGLCLGGEHKLHAGMLSWCS